MALTSFHDWALEELPKRVSDDSLVLDVGGWFGALNRANYVVDIMPYATRNRAGAVLSNLWPEEHFTESTFLNFDICEHQPWPFSDKQFDFVYCSNTLEDVRDPIWVCREMIRVAKSGFVEVPSRILESTRGVERPFYVGYYHHRWLSEVCGTKLSFMFKPAMIHAYRQFYLRKPMFKKVNPRYESVGFFWENAFEFEEKIIIDRDAVQKDLRDFKQAASRLDHLFISKYRLFGSQHPCL